jgi:hypothetical protein
MGAGKILSLVFVSSTCLLEARSTEIRNQSLSDTLCPEMLQVRKEKNKKI